MIKISVHFFLLLISYMYNYNYLLGVPAVSDRLVLIVLKSNVLQQTIGYILHNMPCNWETASPFVLLPIFHILVKINRSCHLCKANKLPTCIDLSKIQILEQVQWK